MLTDQEKTHFLCKHRLLFVEHLLGMVAYAFIVFVATMHLSFAYGVATIIALFFIHNGEKALQKNQGLEHDLQMLVLVRRFKQVLKDAKTHTARNQEAGG